MTRRTSLFLMTGMSLPGVGLPPIAASAPAPAGGNRMRVVCSLSLVNEVNTNDARAAIKVWAVEIAKLAMMDVEPDAEMLLSPERLMEAVRKGDLDAFSATTPEYLKVAAYTDTHYLWVDHVYVEEGEEYTILTHKQSGLRTLADLRGHELLIFTNPTTCLAPNWLDTVLDASNLGAPDKFFKPVVPVVKLSRAVLPVYFRQSAACLVTRRGFATMSEMNPDLSRELCVVATSPKVVPICMAFHRNCPPERKARFSAALTKLSKTPGGRQILALFQSNGIEPVDNSCLRSAEEIVHNSERIRVRAARPGP